MPAAAPYRRQADAADPMLICLTSGGIAGRARARARSGYPPTAAAKPARPAAGPGAPLRGTQKSESAWWEECGQPPAWLLPRREPVLEALYVQRVASEDSDLNLDRIGGVIFV